MSLRKLLEQSGLTTYQQALFIAILHNPHAPVKKLTALSRVPLGRIYTELEALEKKHLIDASNTRPRTYIVVAPRTKILELIELEKEKIEDLEREALKEFAGAQSEKAEVFHTKSEIKQSQIDSFRWANYEVCQCLGILHKPYEKRDLKQIYEREIITAVKKGVVFRALYTKGERPPHALRILHEEHPQHFQIKFSSVTLPRFDIVDSQQVLLKIQDPMDTSETVASIVINNAVLAHRLRQRFIRLWDESSE